MRLKAELLPPGRPATALPLPSAFRYPHRVRRAAHPNRRRFVKNPFKSKTGEKQSLVRLAVIAGTTITIISIGTVSYCVLTESEPRHPIAFVCAAFVGLSLLVATNKSAASGQDNSAKDFWGGRLVLWITVIAILLILAGVMIPTVDKPVIYLYPPQEEAVTVRLDFAGKLTADYPSFDQKLGGWLVTAFPDGHLIDPRDGREYSYLFWEGEHRTDWDLSTGFVVRGSDTRQFLQDTLPKLGLTPREYNEFIVYWYPKLQASRFNLIHFAGREYTDTAVLNVTPSPDSVIRVFMVWEPLATEISLPSQVFPPVNRHGFTVVEWGGTEVR